MSRFDLVPHPDFLPREVAQVTVTLSASPAGLQAIYAVEAPTAMLRLPPPAKPYRTADLWRTTCFELFVREDDAAYREFNFSPSSAWAAYRFSGYRDGMAHLPVDRPPRITVSDESNGLIVSVVLDPVPAGTTLSPTAVIEEMDGTKSFWALAHAPGKPDFHHPASFAATLPIA
jgi:hypothetical protein